MKPKKALELIKNILELANELQEKQNENLRIKKDTKPKCYFESNNEREIIICKDSKEVSPNLEALKSAILTGDGSENKRILKDEPTFTQPKEVGEKAIFNIFPKIERIRKKEIDFTLYYNSNNTVEVFVAKKKYSNVVIYIDDEFLVNSVEILGKATKKDFAWVQNRNKLIIF